MANRFVVEVRNLGLKIPVDLAAAPAPDDGHVEGERGSLLRILLDAGVEIEHSCGGVGACATCHVHVLEGEEHGNEPDEAEEDALEKVRDLRLGSRMACLFFPDGSGDVVVSIPTWNRNAVKEHA